MPVEHHQADEGRQFDIGGDGALHLENVLAEFEVTGNDDLEAEGSVCGHRGRAEVG